MLFDCECTMLERLRFPSGKQAYMLDTQCLCLALGDTYCLIAYMLSS
jgi:hypothetical protein